jgi:hypothetical protein
MRLRHLVPVLLVLSFAAPSAQAYIGPGAGLGLVGSLLGWLLGILLVAFAILAWPLRMLWRRVRGTPRKPDGDLPQG